MTLRVQIVHGNDAGSIREYDDAAAQSLLDTGFAILAPKPEAPVKAETTALAPAEPEAPVAAPEKTAPKPKEPRA